MALSSLHIYYYHYVLFALHGSITSTHIQLPLRTVLSTWLYHVYTYTNTITYCSLYMALSRLHIYYYHYVLFALHGSIMSTHILLPLRTVLSTWLYQFYTYTTTITYCSIYMAHGTRKALLGHLLNNTDVYVIPLLVLSFLQLENTMYVLTKMLSIF